MTIGIEKITKIEDGCLFYDDNGTERRISLRTSADRWWDLYHKPDLADRLLGRKKRNKYAGVKVFGGVSDTRYFKLFDQTEEYCFEIRIGERSLSEILPILQSVNEKLRLQGYRLMDWA